MDLDTRLIQSSSFILVYEFSCKEFFDLSDYKLRLDLNCKYNQLFVFKTSYDLAKLNYEVIKTYDDLKHFVNDKKEKSLSDIQYYYFYFSFACRQKLRIDKINGNLIKPRYYSLELENNKFIFPKVVESRFLLNDLDGLYNILKELVKDDLAVEVTSHLKLVGLPLSVHYENVCKLETLQDVFSYIENNGLNFYAYDFFRKIKFNYDLKKFLKKSNHNSLVSLNPTYIKDLLFFLSNSNIQKNEFFSFKESLDYSLESNLGKQLKELPLGSEELNLKKQFSFSNESIRHSLINDEYLNNIGYYIFSSENLQANLRIAEEIYNNSKDDKKLSNGVKFIIQHNKKGYRFYRKDRKNQGFRLIFPFFSNDLKEKYKILIKE